MKLWEVYTLPSRSDTMVHVAGMIGVPEPAKSQVLGVYAAHYDVDAIREAYRDNPTTEHLMARRWP